MTAKVPVFVENRATEYKYVRFVFYAVSHVQKTTFNEDCGEYQERSTYEAIIKQGFDQGYLTCSQHVKLEIFWDSLKFYKAPLS